ncbi:MAG TPA: PEGA domain-containing protein [Atribacterota bacterium]|nr:PEGA domain-containing protein [Atribacterota bacterium]
MKKLYSVRINSLTNKFLSLIFSKLFILTILLIMAIVVTAIGSEEMKVKIQINNPKPDFSLSLRMDKGIGATYVPGERVRVFIKTDRSSYLTLYRYDSHGNVRLLFPNQEKKDSFIEANHEYYVDYNIGQDASSGVEYIQGFTTVNRVLMTKEMERRLGTEYMPILDGDIDTIIQRLRNTLTGLPLSQWISSEILYYQIIEQRPGSGKIHVDSQPPGADVLLNDRYIGQTPLAMEILKTGEYSLRIELDGYEPWRSEVRINDGKTALVNANLTGIGNYGSIVIRGSAEIARIYLDGQFKRLMQANRDVVLEEITPGFHELRIVLSGYTDWSERIMVRPDERIQMTVNLEKITGMGALEITSNTDQAMIYLDGHFKGVTSAKGSTIITDLLEGSYELRIVKADYQEYATPVKIYNEHTSQVHIQMEKVSQEALTGAISVYCNEDDARIFIDGAFNALTSADKAIIIDELAGDSYEITVIKEGHRIWQEEVMVRAGETISIFADLIKINR